MRNKMSVSVNDAKWKANEMKTWWSIQHWIESKVLCKRCTLFYFHFIDTSLKFVHVCNFFDSLCTFRAIVFIRKKKTPLPSLSPSEIWESLQYVLLQHAIIESHANVCYLYVYYVETWISNEIEVEIAISILWYDSFFENMHFLHTHVYAYFHCVMKPFLL